MSDVLKPVISTVNFIRSFGLNHRQFRQFIAEIGETDLPYHTAVRWLSCGKVLQRFFELRAVIEIFLNEKHRPFTELQNNAWLWKLAFYVDLTKHVNELNLRLQGENKHLPDLYTNINHTTETEFPIDFAIETLSALKINFDTRFSDFDAIANQIKIFQNPFDADIETLAPELQMEMIDLQCSDIIKNKYENSSLLEFYKSLPLTQFDNLHKFARGLFSVFGTTYLCEKTFSKMKHKSTITAMKELTETILEHKQRELTALIAVDLSGAFDNAWWPAIIKRMDLDNVPSSLIQIIQSYLNNKRTVCLSYGGKTVSKNLTKGCPQGSPLSPLLWNILLNDILMNFKSTNAEIICYADDISIICWHYNLEGLKTELVNTLNYVTQWCRSNKLKINPGKTNLIYFHNFHRFQLEFQKTVIKPSNEIKILGMKLSNHRFRTKINFTPHINEILHKAHRMKNLLFSLSGKIWGINSNKRLILYKTLIRPILTYGAEIWFYQINNRCKQKLNSLQYQIVLWATRSFKTSSSNCVHCLAEIPFLTDFIESRLIKYELDQLSEEDQRTFSPHSPSIINGFLRTRMEDMFSNTSDHFPLFFPLGIPKYFRPDFYNVQFVTGHGNFGDFLFRIGAIDDPGCLCGKRKQDSSHLLLECPIFQNYRNRENIEYKDLFMFSMTHLLPAPYKSNCTDYLGQRTSIDDPVNQEAHAGAA
ncbi:EPM2AIP1 [Cordylochernes scorpioides]|uniref:EPM2AIP1 n=1 Tax=Cordylochernes scorpioides TaxID=51811 RepID=A0ABY6LF96_9ARAC|nr:EPM2AIP1 [Cordylochernes scorpioides]